MIDPNRIFPSNPLGGLAIVGLLVSMTGCAQWSGRAPLPKYLSDPASEVTSNDRYQAPAASAVASPESSVVRFDQAAQAGTGQIQQVSHHDRHVARQQPVPPGGQFIPSGTQPATIPPVPTKPVPNQPPPNQPPPNQPPPDQPWVANQVVTANQIVVPNQNAAGQNVVPVQATDPPINPPPIGSPYDYHPPFVPGLGPDFPPYPTDPVYTPNVREADLIINGYPGRTGRITFGAAVNSDAGVTGQITVDERNFDIFRFPRSFQDLFRGNAFRGKGQTLRIEATPGSQFDRYIIQFANPNLFTYLPITMSLSGFLYDRAFQDWSEQRLGGRLGFGYRLTPDLSLSVAVGGQNVEIYNPRNNNNQDLNEVVDNNGNALYSGSISLKHDTRNTPIQPSEGHYFETKFEEAFGDFDYSRFEMEYRTYWLLAQRADFSGKQTLSYSTQLGFTGKDTPIFENFFAGGYATLRGFDFRGASPVSDGIEVGGEFQWLNSVEYMFPITADDAFRGVAFVDFGTVEESITITPDTFRVSPGLGLRVAIPMLGPAPLAFDFAYPVAKADTDQTRVFSFYMSVVR